MKHLITLLLMSTGVLFVNLLNNEAKDILTTIELTSNLEVGNGGWDDE